MHYTVMFYAMGGEAFARQLRESSEEMLAKVQRIFREQTPEDDSAWNVLRERVLRICHGDLPANCDRDYFYALSWLAEAAAERVPICGFEGFRHLRFLEELAIWPEFQRYPCPFPLPRCADDYFSAGYLPVEGIRVFTEVAFPQLPPSTDGDVVNLRDDFHYTLTTLLADNLDLLAVLGDTCL